MMLIRAENIHKSYAMKNGELPILKGIDLEILEGELVTIVGPSGAGKSTLLHILGALDKPSKGEIHFLNEKVSGMHDVQMAKLRNKHIGFVFQFHHLLPEFSALENIMMPALIAGNKIDSAKDYAQELLSRVGLSDRATHRPSELSGGEQQRVAVARALMNKPKIVMADEPSGNLDRQTSENLHDLLFELCETHKQTFLIVTHNEGLAKRSHRMINMLDGRIVS